MTKYHLGIKLALSGWIIALIGFLLAYNHLLIRELSFVIVVSGITLGFVGIFIAGIAFKKLKGNECDNE